MYARGFMALIVCVAVFGAFWKAYHNGYTRGAADVEAEYQAKALEAEKQARTKEQELLKAKTDAEARYAREKTVSAMRLAAAESELDGLRGDLQALGSASSSNPASVTGTDAGAGPLRDILGHCATALTELAGQADRLENQVLGLQTYIRGVCK